MRQRLVQEWALRFLPAVSAIEIQHLSSSALVGPELENGDA